MERPFYKLVVLVVSLFALSSFALSQAGYNLVTSYNHDVGDTLRWYNPTPTSASGAYPLHVRDVFAGADADNDGKMEIIATDYNQGGRVHVFEQAGPDSLELVWSSPFVQYPDATSSDSSPRNVLVTDLDADGFQEITFLQNSDPMSDVGGVYVFEWDGTTDNGYGTVVSSLFNIDLTLGRFRIQNILASDVDNDGRQELLVADDGSGSEDLFFILSVAGNIISGSGGSFELWNEEFRLNPRDNSNFYGGGSAYSFAVADLDGDANNEIVFTTFNFANVFVAQSTAADTYVLNQDTSASANRFLFVTPGSDDVTLRKLAVADYDGDGNDEVYLTPFIEGNIYVVNYSPSDNVLEIDTNHVRRIATDVTGGSAFSISTARHGSDLGDIFTVGAAGSDLALTRYEGGAIDDPLSYSTELIYQSDVTTDFIRMTIRDSLGVVDTVHSFARLTAAEDVPFAVGLASGQTVDFDNDQRLEVVLGYQSIDNLLGTIQQSYDTTSQAFMPVDTTFVDNPNARIIRVVEVDVVTGIEVRDLTIITPEDYQLDQNYPNPFNPSTTISFRLPLNKKISLRIYDVLGKEVRTLIDDEEYASGSYQVVWDSRNQQGQFVGSGTYFYRLEFGNFSKSKKMLLVK